MCELTEGKAGVPCDTVGGSKRAILYSLKDSLGITNYATPPTIVEGSCVAIALKPTKKAYIFNYEVETAEADATSTGEKPNSATAHEHRVVLMFAGNTAADVAMGTKLVKDRVGIILELQDGSYELFHFENGAKGQRTRSIGKALDEFNGSTWTFTSRQKLPEAKIDSVLVQSLIDNE